jgi:hypothetical protein
MKGNKVLVYAICGFVAVAAAVTAVYVFRNEIADFFVDIKARIDEKRLTRTGEYADYENITHNEKARLCRVFHWRILNI